MISRIYMNLDNWSLCSICERIVSHLCTLIGLDLIALAFFSDFNSLERACHEQPDACQLGKASVSDDDSISDCLNQLESVEMREKNLMHFSSGLLIAIQAFVGTWGTRCFFKVLETTNWCWLTDIKSLC